MGASWVGSTILAGSTALWSLLHGSAQILLAVYLQALAAVNSTATQLRRLEELYIAATAMNPNGNWQWIRDLAARVRHRHQPVRDKRPRLVGIDDLEELGLSLMRRAEMDPGLPRRRALLYRNGLIIASLIARPLRLANFAGLRLDKHLIRRGKTWWLIVPKAETKTDSLIEMSWPETLVAQLETYLGTYRPALIARKSLYSHTRQAGQALWVAASGAALNSQALYNLIVTHTRKAFGRSLSPHLFRDCAATGIAVEDPVHVRMGSPLLGHRDHATMERYYNQAGSVEAAQRWQRNLANLRRRPPTDPAIDVA
jgi:integrase/recombinase XerD